MPGYILLYATALCLSTLVLVGYRLRVVLDPRRTRPHQHGRRTRPASTHLLVVLGSGGHTTEMMAMLERAVSEKDPALRLDWSKFTRRSWVVSSGDSISAERARRFEEWASSRSGLADDATEAVHSNSGTYEIRIVPRARKIHQSLLTAPWSSLICLLACVNVLVRDGTTPSQDKRDLPDLIICNGPATATILVLTSVLLRIINYKGSNSRGKMRTVYIESWARVKRLSLSGKLLLHVVDRFMVQWPQLEREGSRAEYIGVLV